MRACFNMQVLRTLFQNNFVGIQQDVSTMLKPRGGNVPDEGKKRDKLKGEVQ